MIFITRVLNKKETNNMQMPNLSIYIEDYPKDKEGIFLLYSRGVILFETMAALIKRGQDEGRWL